MEFPALADGTAPARGETIRADPRISDTAVRCGIVGGQGVRLAFDNVCIAANQIGHRGTDRRIDSARGRAILHLVGHLARGDRRGEGIGAAHQRLTMGGVKHIPAIGGINLEKHRGRRACLGATVMDRAKTRWVAGEELIGHRFFVRIRRALHPVIACRLLHGDDLAPADQAAAVVHHQSERQRPVALRACQGQDSRGDLFDHRHPVDGPFVGEIVQPLRLQGVEVGNFRRHHDRLASVPGRRAG